ncbi:hypothetical protein D3C72_954790 [compost metagenome]
MLGFCAWPSAARRRPSRCGSRTVKRISSATSKPGKPTIKNVTCQGRIAPTQGTTTLSTLFSRLMT